MLAQPPQLVEDLAGEVAVLEPDHQYLNRT
jgi:hypothetical protein